MQFLVTIEGDEEAIKEGLCRTLGVSYWILEDLIKQCIDEGISPLNPNKTFPDPHTKLEVERRFAPIKED